LLPALTQVDADATRGTPLALARAFDRPRLSAAFPTLCA
jgi:hypothetical protein